MTSPTGPPSPTQETGDTLSGGVPGLLAKAAWQTIIATGVAATALGVIILVWPGATLLVVAALFGIYLLVAGAFQLAAAFGRHVPGYLRALAFLSGALSVLLGLICFRAPMQSILLLALWIGFGWLLRGITQIAAAISADGLPGRGWQLVLGVITIIGAIVLITSPIRSIATLTLVAGIWLVVLGVAEVMHGLTLRGLFRRRA